MIGIVVEGRVERVESIYRNERQDGPSKESQVFRPLGFAPCAAIFPPAGSVPTPVVFVFHRPMPAAKSGKTKVAGHALLDTCDEVAGFNRGLATVLHLAVTGEAAHLPCLGKETHVKVELANTQFTMFEAPMIAFDLRTPGRGKMVELLTGNPVQGGLVVFEGEKVIGTGLMDDQRRFF